MQCRAPDCGRESRTTYGLCVMHYKRFKRNGDTERVIQQYEAGTPCSHCGKVEKLRKFLCKACALRKNRKGYVERDIAPAGSGTTNTAGYRLLTVNGKREYEHRVIARALPGEVVHHADRDRGNNDPTNLVVLANQSEHSKLHQLERKNDSIKKED